MLFSAIFALRPLTWAPKPWPPTRITPMRMRSLAPITRPGAITAPAGILPAVNFTVSAVGVGIASSPAAERGVQLALTAASAAAAAPLRKSRREGLVGLG